jgi:hypothetical protein
MTAQMGVVDNDDTGEANARRMLRGIKSRAESLAVGAGHDLVIWRACAVKNPLRLSNLGADPLESDRGPLP